MLQNFNFDLIVDVGANRGQFALISRKYNPAALIISFEPLEEAARIFKDVFKNDHGVIIKVCAIGQFKEKTLMHVSSADDSSSILPITASQNKLFPGTTETEIREIDVFPLSTAIEGNQIPVASLLKIDVQGYEMEVLKGSVDKLWQFSHLYIECSFVELYKGQALAHQIINWLHTRNFEICGVYNVYYDKNGRAIQGDFLFSQIK
ncbi:MAG: FkbM family methyltransferase [Chloroflexota bacterium]